MYCRNCGQQVDETQTVCQHCGTAQSEVVKIVEKPKKPITKRWWFWVIIVFLAFSILGRGPSSNREDNDPPETPTGTVITTGNPENDGIYREGMYAVGTDIEPGEYYIYCTNDIGCYFAVYKDSSGTLDSIIANENIDSFAFVTVKAGQYLQVKRGNFIESSKAVLPKADPNGFYVAGMYRVGIDIPAGEYKLVADPGDMAYVAVYKDGLNTLSSIVTNENFENTYYLSVEEGQYLYIKRGAFKFVK